MKNSRQTTCSIQPITQGLRLFMVFLLLCTVLTFQSLAQDGLSADEVAEANNPLASIKTFNFHNYYVPGLYDLPDATSNTMWLRYAQPIGRVLLRASLPLSTVPMPGQADKSGIGDMNAFGAYLVVQNPKTTLGIGPLIAAPTASDDALGSGKWQAGLALIIFEIVSPQLQLGGLITWQTSFAGDEDREKTNFMALQAFGIWQLGGGTYLRSSGISQFNLVNGTYNVPFGMGIGKVIKSGSVVFNIFAEPQFTILHYGTGQPQLQFFFGINTQF